MELAAVRELAGRVAPVALAREQLLPVLPPLVDLLPPGLPGLRRGSVLLVAGQPPGRGARSLAFSLAAGASRAGSWVALAGMADLGGVAVSEAGLDLARVAVLPSLVPTRAGGGAGGATPWPTVIAALIDAIDVVVLQPPPKLRPADARRLQARARERGSVLIVLETWPEAADLRFTVAASTWHGLGAGHGALRARDLEVAAEGRGAAARPRRVGLSLPLESPNELG